MRGRPRQLLHVDANAGVLAFEIGDQRADDLALAAHGPETHDRYVGCALRAASRGHRCEREERGGEKAPPHGPASGHCTDAASQPPEKPARVRPSRTYRFSRITLQMSPLR